VSGTGPLRLTGPLARGGAPRGLLRNRRFWLLWFGGAASQVGDRVHQIAVLWWALHLAGQLADAGWILVAQTVPLVLLAPLGGAIADRYPRRAVMLGCDLGRAAIAAGLAALAAGGGLTLPVVLVTTALLGALTAIFIPASMAMVPDVVDAEHLVKAGSLQEVTLQIATIAGPALGGVLVAAAGTGPAFGLNAASFALSAVALAFLGRVPAPAGAAGPRSWRADLRDGLAVAREWPAIGALLAAFGLSNFFSAPLLLYLPRYADLFGVGAAGLGFLEAALAAGTLLASFALLASRDPPGPRVLAPACLAAIGALMVGLGRVSSYLVFLGGLAAIGFALGALNVTVLAYFQRTVPPQRLGRFMGLLTAVVFAAPSLGFALAGALASNTHPGPFVTIQGWCVLAVATGLAATLARGFRADSSSSRPTAS